MGKNEVRKTIYISEELQKKLEQESVVSGLSQTELIRQAVTAYLETPVADRAAELPARYPDDEEDERQKKRMRLLGSLAGFIEDDDLPEDLAINHDKYLYGGEE